MWKEHVQTAAATTAAVTLILAGTALMTAPAWAQGQGGKDKEIEATELDCETPCVQSHEIEDGTIMPEDLGFNPDTLGALDCADGEVPKIQADGSWACQADSDTSAATECGLGEVLVADGAGGGVCMSLVSACPCEMGLALSSSFTWFNGGVVQCTTTDTVPGTEAGVIKLENFTDEGKPDWVQLRQVSFSPYSVFIFMRGDGVTHCTGTADDGIELNACIADFEAISILLGVECSAPVFVPQL